MKTLVIYYSYTGHTKALATVLVAVESADVAEIKDVVRPGTFKAYAAGCFAAIRGKTWPIQPLDVDWEAYDRLILMSPVWASSVPPEVNSLLTRLPEGKSVYVKMVSKSGHSECKSRLETIIKAKSGTLDGFEDIKV